MLCARPVQERCVLGFLLEVMGETHTEGSETMAVGGLGLAQPRVSVRAGHGL